MISIKIVLIVNFPFIFHTFHLLSSRVSFAFYGKENLPVLVQLQSHCSWWLQYSLNTVRKNKWYLAIESSEYKYHSFPNFRSSENLANMRNLPIYEDTVYSNTIFKMKRIMHQNYITITCLHNLVDMQLRHKPMFNQFLVVMVMYLQHII